MSKSQRHTRSGAGRGVSQANEATIYPKLTGLCQLEIVSGNLKKWKHISDSASQLWVPGRSRVHGRPYLNFPPITLQRFNFRSWWVCRWMPIWKRSRLVPFLSWWGYRKGGLKGGAGVSTPKSVRAIPEKKSSWRALYICFCLLDLHQEIQFLQQGAWI